MSNRDYWRERQATDATVWMLHQTGQIDLIADAIANGETPSHVAAELALIWRTPYVRLEKAIAIALREKAEWERIRKEEQESEQFHA